MPAHHSVLSLGVAVCAGLLFEAPSWAHIDLVSPSPRAAGRPDSNLEESPCGQRDTVRVAENVSVFRPGETITVVWDVYVQHPSYFRLAFDLDGDDSFSERSALPANPEQDDPTALPPGEGELILAYVEDRAGELERVEHPITLPRAPCDDCTLQLTQLVYGLPLREATYYQCADITLDGTPVPPAADGGSAAAVAGELPPSSEPGCSLTAVGAPRRAGYMTLIVAALLLGRATARRLGCPRASVR